MGRQSTDDPTTTMMDKGSSIAPLQERLRQLQRVREKREELLKLFSGKPAGNNLSFQSEMIFPPPTPQDLSLRLNSLISKPAEFRATRNNSVSPFLDKSSDVDTSLRL
ncbi:hypothetical protein RHMOL_Rhmol04G0060800 [Rhododendron molle]|uniref:Uncharacterized protein n=1 Tax=Rhododendron molle TaxID=49168 RepID=A0ACC0NXN3_RHOML|nr:hypothetical protein RHMOL_Rhmol04G0060800 [Rhododendron molle]